MSSAAKGRFFSLKWKAALLVSVVLLLALGAMIHAGSASLQAQYESQRASIHRNRHDAVDGVLVAAQLQLQRLAEQLQVLDAGDRDGVLAIGRTLDRHWSQMQFQWDLDSALLYDAELELSRSWGNAAMDSRPIRRMVGSATATERPQGGVFCESVCLHMAAVPVLSAGRVAGALVLTSPMADAVIHFRKITNAHVGIMLRADRDAVSQVEGGLPAWGARLVAISDAPKNRPLVELLSTRHDIADLLDQRRRIQYRGRHYEASLVPLSAAESPNPAYLVLLENVTADLVRIEAAVGTIVFNALLAMFFAGGLLLTLLWRPTDQLSRISALLPLLARNSYAAVREQLGSARSNRRIVDEIDLLDRATFDLTDTLETLDRRIELKTESLRQRSRELIKQRDFVTGLLDNAQVIILTLDEHRRIGMVNDQGSLISGFEESELAGRDFIEAMIAVDAREQVEASLREMVDSGHAHLHHESPMVAKNGERLHVSWYHSLLTQREDGDPLYLSVGLDLTGRKKAEDELAWLADHDSLTELLNRRRFQQEFESALQRAKRYQTAGALLFFDIDQFKLINDTSGHQAGDLLLKQVADSLRRNVRDTDAIARLGGDEFGVLVDRVNREEAAAVADKLCRTLSSIVTVADSLTHRITVSMGLVVFPHDGDSVQELMATADLAMYKAKEAGRARPSWHAFSATETGKEELQKRVDWKARIEDALEDDRFVLYYQPILDIRNRRVSHYEALLRMLDTNGETVPPGLFINVAEQTGLIREIDNKVLHLAIADQARFQRAGRRVSLSVNLSAQAIGSDDFIQVIAGLADQHGVSAANIILELTETSAVGNIGAAAEMMEQCKQLGYQFALDDFGVGFSSWFYLRQLPVDYVKIDGTFIRELAANREDQLFVRAINEVAQGLGRRTIAEYVEDRTSLELLDRYGVDYAQGYHIGKPMPQLLHVDTQREWTDPGATSTDVRASAQ